MIDVKIWMRKKKLKLSETKTKCMLVGTPSVLKDLGEFTELEIDGTMVELIKRINKLEMALDQEFSMRKQVRKSSTNWKLPSA